MEFGSWSGVRLGGDDSGSVVKHYRFDNTLQNHCRKVCIDMIPSASPNDLVILSRDLLIFSQTEEDIKIPSDLLKRPGCDVPLKAISLLKKRLGEDAAVCGKVFGSWTQSYHYFGVEDFLMMTIDDPAKVHRIMDKLLPVTVEFARKHIFFEWKCFLIARSAGVASMASPIGDGSQMRILSVSICANSILKNACGVYKL